MGVEQLTGPAARARDVERRVAGTVGDAEAAAGVDELELDPKLAVQLLLELKQHRDRREQRLTVSTFEAIIACRPKRSAPNSRTRS